MKSIKSEPCEEEEVKEEPFPKLMENSRGRVVFFMVPCKGMIVHPSSHSKHSNGWRLGSIKNYFNMKYYKDYEGSITLCNN